jgi:hypothetical protein
VELHIIAGYAVYLVASIAMVIWVARTLHRNGRIFLIDSLDGNIPLADSLNSLLVVGFCLINIGYVNVALRWGVRPESLVGVVEAVSANFGWVLLVLGAMHFINMWLLNRIRKRAKLLQAPPPIAPSAWVKPPLKTKVEAG